MMWSTRHQATVTRVLLSIVLFAPLTWGERCGARPSVPPSGDPGGVETRYVAVGEVDGVSSSDGLSVVIDSRFSLPGSGTVRTRTLITQAPGAKLPAPGAWLLDLGAFSAGALAPSGLYERLSSRLGIPILDSPAPSPCLKPAPPREKMGSPLALGSWGSGGATYFGFADPNPPGAIGAGVSLDAGKNGWIAFLAVRTAPDAGPDVGTPADWILTKPQTVNQRWVHLAGSVGTGTESFSGVVESAISIGTLSPAGVSLAFACAGDIPVGGGIVELSLNAISRSSGYRTPSGACPVRSMRLQSGVAHQLPLFCWSIEHRLDIDALSPAPGWYRSTEETIDIDLTCDPRPLLCSIGYSAEREVDRWAPVPVRHTLAAGIAVDRSGVEAEFELESRLFEESTPFSTAFEGTIAGSVETHDVEFSGGVGLSRNREGEYRVSPRLQTFVSGRRFESTLRFSRDPESADWHLVELRVALSASGVEEEIWRE